MAGLAAPFLDNIRARYYAQPATSRTGVAHRHSQSGPFAGSWTLGLVRFFQRADDGVYGRGFWAQWFAPVWQCFHRPSGVRLHGWGGFTAFGIGYDNAFVHWAPGLLLRAFGHDGKPHLDTSKYMGGIVVLARSVFITR